MCVCCYQVVDLSPLLSFTASDVMSFSTAVSNHQLEVDCSTECLSIVSVNLCRIDYCQQTSLLFELLLYAAAKVSVSRNMQSLHDTQLES